MVSFLHIHKHSSILDLLSETEPQKVLLQLERVITSIKKAIELRKCKAIF